MGDTSQLENLYGIALNLPHEQKIFWLNVTQLQKNFQIHKEGEGVCDAPQGACPGGDLCMCMRRGQV